MTFIDQHGDAWDTLEDFDGAPVEVQAEPWQLNGALLQRTREHIAENPELHQQSAWITAAVHEPSCGTAACAAGWLALLGDGIEHTTLEQARHYEILMDSEYQSLSGIRERAIELAGLHDEDADVLFASDTEHAIVLRNLDVLIAHAATTTQEDPA